MTDNASSVTEAVPAEEKLPENAAISGSAALPPDELARLTEDIICALKTVYDPEIPADIYELGLVYRVDIEDDHTVKIEMSLTSPNCPSAQELPIMVENAVSSVPGVKETKVAVVWDPPWDPSRMSDEARLVLNMW
ncbi:MAG TPA: SUF system Fe-S cluster assembly protein [Pseudolabrys sp.]|jgi:FeS assembly SUF system protein|nr:SUF system Fe-S cluster assembly protein [Pseudolabrys sp.]